MPFSNEETMEVCIQDLIAETRDRYELGLAYDRLLKVDGLDVLVQTMVAVKLHAPETRNTNWEHHANNFAFVIGAERGKHLGKLRGIEVVLQARQFAAMQ